jgi:hypothetical protein
MRFLVLAVTLFSGLVSCSHGLDPTTIGPATAPSSNAQTFVSVPSSFRLDKGRHAICPFLWTCDEVHWFSTQTACTLSCGPNCIQDFRCNGTCTCP